MSSVSILFKLDSPIFSKLCYSNVQVNQIVRLIHNPLTLSNPLRKLLMKYDNQTKYLNMFQVIKPKDQCKIYLKLRNIVQLNPVNSVIVNVQDVISQFQEFMLSNYSIQLQNHIVVSNYINTIVVFNNYHTNVNTIYDLVMNFISANQFSYNMFDLTIYPLVETVIIPLVNQSESKNNNEYRYYFKSNVGSSDSTELDSTMLNYLINYINNCKPLVLSNKVINKCSKSNSTVIPSVDDDIITRLMTTIREVMILEDYEDELITYLSEYYDKHQTYIGCKYDIQLIKYILTSILLG